MACRYCNDTRIQISPIGGTRWNCIECLPKKIKTSEVQYDEGSGIANKDGYIHWKVKGEFHKPDGPAVIYANGSKFWYIHGKPHRKDGPASEYANGSKFWYIYGERHRDDGPAVEISDGANYWYLNDVRFTKKDFEEKFKDLSS